MSNNFGTQDRQGRAFEDEVAHFLRTQGFAVHQRCYVPYHPGCSNVAEVDILAVRNGAVWVFECKSGSGTMVVSPDSELWSRIYGSTAVAIINPLKQAQSQGEAVRRNLQCEVVYMVVLEDTIDLTTYDTAGLTSFNALRDSIDRIKNVSGNFVLTDAAKLALYNWEHPDDQTVANHVSHVITNKNKKILRPYKEGQGIDMYCVSLLERYFLCFVDTQGRCWGTESVDDAALFSNLKDAERALYDCGIDGEVCTLKYGYPEFMSAESTDEEMTVDEYAYDVCAFPYCI